MIEQHRHSLIFTPPFGVYCHDCEYRLTGNNLIEFLESITDTTPGNPAPAPQGDEFRSDAVALARLTLEVCSWPTECPRDIEFEATRLARKLTGEQE